VVDISQEQAVNKRQTKADAPDTANDATQHQPGKTLSSSYGSTPVDTKAQNETRQTDTRALADNGLIPRLDVHGTIDKVVMTVASEEDRQLIHDMDAVAKRAGSPALTERQKLAIENLRPDEKEMYRDTITELNKLANGEITPAQYMADGLKNAASLAEKNGRASDSWNIFQPSKADLYCNYVGLAFSEHSLGRAKDFFRSGAGSGMSVPGSALEDAYQGLIGSHAAQGFNANVADVDPTNSITHHYREFLNVGYRRGRSIGDWATTEIDKPEVNPGDVRNGYFATMIGSALKNDKITPTEAADLTIWAYTMHGGTQPLWGDANKKGNFLDPKDYFLNPWLKAYRESQSH
jgi:hypothetical protein